MKSPRFSIIIPVYNAAEYLQPLMKQLQNQTLQDFELIFVNDSSPDNSAEILTRLEKEDDRVRVFTHENNKCQGAARNTGLNNARGEYILYIDADDFVPKNYLESLFNAIEKYDANIAICNSIWVYPSHEVHHNMFIDNPNLPELLLTGEEALQRYFFIFKKDIRIRLEPWGRIIRRSLIEKHHLRFPDTLHEDVVMGFSELLLSRKVLFLNKYLYYYNRKNYSSVTVIKRRQYLRDFPFIFIGFRKVLLDNGLYEQHKKWLTRFYFRSLVGMYDWYSKGEDFSQEMNEAIRYYRTLLQDPLIDGSENYISNKLIDFKLEMQRNNISEIFSLFIEAHPEVKPLVDKNLRYCFMYYPNLVMRYRSVRDIFRRIVKDPRTETRRQFITNILRVYNRIRKNFS